MELYELQQYLPFTVLKRNIERIVDSLITPRLQQYLPFTVLKPKRYDYDRAANAYSCNSTYRLRY